MPTLKPNLHTTAQKHKKSFFQTWIRINLISNSGFGPGSCYNYLTLLRIYLQYACTGYMYITRTCVNYVISVLFSENDAHNPYFDCKLCFSGSRLYIYFQAVIKGIVQPDWICMRVVSMDRPWNWHQPLEVFNFLISVLNIWKDFKVLIHFIQKWIQPPAHSLHRILSS